MGNQLTTGAALLGLTLLGAVAVLFAWLLRRSAVPGGALAAGLLGGLIAGVLLGPGVLGRAAPEAHEAMYIGAAEQRAELERAELELEAELATLRTTGVSEAALRERLDAGVGELAALDESLEQARRRTRSLFDGAALLAFLLILVTAPWRTAGRPRTDDEPWQGPLLGGLCSLIFAGAPAAALGVWTLDMSRPEALAFGAAISIGAAWPGLRARVVGRPGRRRGVDRAALVAYLAGAGVIIALTRDVFIAALFAAPLVVAWPAKKLRLSRSSKRFLKGLSSGALAPILTAAACVHFDPVAGAATWPFWIAILIAAIFSSDGRWLGGWLGWWTGGEQGARSESWRRSAATLNSGVGAVQIGAAAVLAGVFFDSAGGALMDDRTLMAVALGAVIVELTAGLRIRFAKMLDRGAPFAGVDGPER